MKWSSDYIFFLLTAMDTLGISPVNEKVEGASEDKINFDTFLSQA